MLERGEIMGRDCWKEEEKRQGDEKGRGDAVGIG